MRFRLMAAAVGFAAWICCVAQAWAQDDAALLRDGLFARDYDIAVAERSKAEYDPVPIHLGAAIVTPSVIGGWQWNSDVFATSARPASDEIAYLQPSLSLSFDWSRHQLAAFARLNQSIYLTYSGEDTTDYAAGATGRLDAERTLGFAGGVGVERDTEPRTDEASPVGSIHPVQYDLASAWVEGTKALNRLRLTARFSIDDFGFSNARSLAGVEIYEGDQSHTTSIGAFKIEYAERPDVSILASLIVNDRSYRDPLPGEAVRSSSGYEAAVGANFDITHLSRGEVLIGYTDQEYARNLIYKPIRGLALHAKLQYFLTQLMTITLSGSRDVKDSGIPGVDGYVSSTGSVRLDHELLRNLVLTASASYTLNHYDGYSRDDRIEQAEFAAAYLLNRAISIQLRLSDLTQGSEGVYAGRRYDVKLAALSLKFSL